MDILKKHEESQQEGTLKTSTKENLKYEKHDVDGSPFIVIEAPKENNEESDFTVVLGKYKVEEFENLEEAIKYCTEITWDKIFQVVGILIESDKQMEKEKEKLQENIGL